MVKERAAKVKWAASSLQPWSARIAACRYRSMIARSRDSAHASRAIATAALLRAICFRITAPYSTLRRQRRSTLRPKRDRLKADVWLSCEKTGDKVTALPRRAVADALGLQLPACASARRPAWLARAARPDPPTRA